MLDKIKLYALIASGTIIMLLAGALYVQHAEVKGLRTSVTSLTNELATEAENVRNLKDANDAQDKARQELATLFATCNDQRAKVDDLFAAAKARAAEADARAGRALAQLRASKETIYATDQQCSAWGDAPVCGAISGSVRDQWNETRSAGSDQAGTGPHDGNALRTDPRRGDEQARVASRAGAGRTDAAGLPALLLLKQATVGHALDRPVGPERRIREARPRRGAVLATGRHQPQTTQGEPHTMNPTVGRILWLYGADGGLNHATELYDDSGKPVHGYPDQTIQPLPVQVCYVHSLGGNGVGNNACVNVAGFDANGNTFTRKSVTLWNGEGASPLGLHARWMPYQQAQAAKASGHDFDIVALEDKFASIHERLRHAGV